MYPVTGDPPLLRGADQVSVAELRVREVTVGRLGGHGLSNASRAVIGAVALLNAPSPASFSAHTRYS
jgi:hypothetical protein